MSAGLQKDPAILELLDRLRERLGAGAFVLVDYLDADLCAVGVASPHDKRFLAYVSSYNNPEGRYDVELEEPPRGNKDDPYSVARRHRDADVEAVVEIVRGHLSQGHRRKEGQP